MVESFWVAETFRVAETFWVAELSWRLHWCQKKLNIYIYVIYLESIQLKCFKQLKRDLLIKSVN